MKRLKHVQIIDTSTLRIQSVNYKPKEAIIYKFYRQKAHYKKQHNIINQICLQYVEMMDKIIVHKQALHYKQNVPTTFNGFGHTPTTKTSSKL